jgi:hypothetical protein
MAIAAIIIRIEMDTRCANGGRFFRKQASRTTASPAMEHSDA